VTASPARAFARPLDRFPVGSWPIRKFRVSRITARLAGFRPRTRPWMMRGTDNIRHG
jgi:hypothetical protein